MVNVTSQCLLLGDAHPLLPPSPAVNNHVERVLPLIIEAANFSQVSLAYKIKEIFGYSMAAVYTVRVALGLRVIGFEAVHSSIHKTEVPWLYCQALMALRSEDCAAIPDGAEMEACSRYMTVRYCSVGRSHPLRRPRDAYPSCT